MKIKPGFELHNVCGENVILASGIENINFTKIISLNETAAFAWKAICDKEFEVKDIAEALLSEYEVDEATATADAQNLVNEWTEAGLI